MIVRRVKRLWYKNSTRLLIKPCRKSIIIQLKNGNPRIWLFEFYSNCYPAVDSTLYLDEKQKFWSDAIRYYFKRYDNRITAEIFNGKTLIPRLCRQRSDRYGPIRMRHFHRYFRKWRVWNLKTNSKQYVTLHRIHRLTSWIFKSKHIMYDVILSFITAFTLTYLAIPSIINVAKTKHILICRTIVVADHMIPRYQDWAASLFLQESYYRSPWDSI